jgi:ubiquinone/menaquinone biosynthesis C-methylase UbiE
MAKRYRGIAEYYDFENEHLEMLREDVPFFLRQMPRRCQNVLELATGTARAAIPIAQAGHRVVGVDYAADMLAIAQRKRDGVGLGKRELELVRSDILQLDLGRRFDWVCIFFNTFLAFTTLKEQDALLQVVRRHLRPRGRFWLDIFQPNPDLLAQEQSQCLHPHAFFVPRYDRTVFQTASVQRDIARQLQHIQFHYEWFDADGVRQEQRVAFDLTFLFPRELQLLLERNGLRIERLWGDYDGSAPCGESPRIIARCCLR